MVQVNGKASLASLFTTEMPFGLLFVQVAQLLMLELENASRNWQTKGIHKQEIASKTCNDRARRKVFARKQVYGES